MIPDMFFICAPHRSHQNTLVSVPSQPVYDHIFRYDFKTFFQKTDIFVFRKHTDAAALILFFQIGILKDMQKLQFDSVRPRITDIFYGREHIGTAFSGKAQYQEYNRGGLTEAETSEGDRIGGSLGGGYTYMLSPSLNLEIGAGVWAGYERYTTYACPECGRVVGQGERNFVLPNDFLLGLVYVF